MGEQPRRRQLCGEGADQLAGTIVAAIIDHNHLAARHPGGGERGVGAADGVGDHRRLVVGGQDGADRLREGAHERRTS